MADPDPRREARRARQSRRREIARGDMLEGAMRVLLRDGLAGFTLESVSRECGVTKQGLLYHFAGKDELVFELFIEEWAAMADAIGDAVALAADGPASLEAIIETYVARYQGKLELFRLVTQKVQQYDYEALPPEWLARVRPINDRMFAEAACKLAKGKLAPGVDPRRLAFSAHLAAIGILTMKSLVEHFRDPLRYSDRELVDEMCGVFRSATQKRGRK